MSKYSAVDDGFDDGTGPYLSLSVFNMQVSPINEKKGFLVRRSEWFFVHVRDLHLSAGRWNCVDCYFYSKHQNICLESVAQLTTINMHESCHTGPG